MLIFSLLAILAVTDASFIVYEGDGLSGFLQTFRQQLLEVVAIEVNETVDLTEALKTEVEICKPKLQNAADNCKACAKDKCSEDPSFEDYLQLANPYTYLKEPLDNIGDKIQDAIDLVGDKASGFYNSLKGLGDAFTGENFEDAFKNLYDALHLQEVADFFENLYSNVLNLDDLFSDIGDFFGKKRRKRMDVGAELRLFKLFARAHQKLKQRSTIDPELRQCMKEKCSSCDPILQPTKEDTVKAVCGDAISNLNSSIHARVQKMETVYNYTLDKVNPIVSKVEVNTATFDFFTGVVGEVYITVYLSDAQPAYRYRTDVAYSPMDVDTSARLMALEYWNLF